MEYLDNIQINIVLSILLFILIGHAFFNMNRRKTNNRVFMWMIALIGFILVMEIIDTTLNRSNLNQYKQLHWLVNVIGFILTPCIPFLGYIFIKGWINRFQSKKISISWMLIIPLIINALATLLSHNKYGLFYITSQNIYQRGVFFFILPCISYLYFIYNLYFLFRNRKKLVLSEQAIFSMFYIVPAIFTGVQLKNPSFLTTWNSAAIVIVITYIFILNDQSYRDSLTGLSNRLYYERYTQNLSLKKLNQLVLVFIDIDGFKSINDQLGHRVGDEAIQIFADLLLDSFPLRQRAIIRIGGDEFLVLVQGKDQNKVENYIDNFTHKLEEYNNRKDNNYQLHFSYGLSCYESNFENVCQLLESADQLMYEQKQNRKNASVFTS